MEQVVINFLFNLTLFFTLHFVPLNSQKNGLCTIYYNLHVKQLQIHHQIF